MKPIASALFATALTAITALPAWAQSVTITVAHEEPADTATSAAHMSATVFKSMVEGLSNGDMAVDIQPQARLVISASAWN